MGYALWLSWMVRVKHNVALLQTPNVGVLDVAVLTTHKHRLVHVRLRC